MAAFVTTNAKAIADPEPLPKPVPQRAGRIAPASAPLVLDAAKPYSFAYEVIDPLGGNAFGHKLKCHKETSDGGVTSGEYRVVLPDTRTQIVTYSVSAETGYVAKVSYEAVATKS